MINGIPKIQNVHGMLQYLPNNFNLSKLDTGNEAEYKTFLDELFFVNQNTLSI